VQLVPLDDRVGLGDLLPPHALEIEPARVLLRVPVGPTEGHPAPALEPRQPHAPPASRAPVCLHRRRPSGTRLQLLLLLPLYLRVDHALALRRGDGDRRKERGGRRSGRDKGLIESQRLLFFVLQITVAFGAQVLRGWAPEEAAVVNAQFQSLASMLFRHF